MRKRTRQTIEPYGEAIQHLQRLLKRAQRAGLSQPTAASLATVDSLGRPSVRMVLLKEVRERGVVFYTNLQSRKGRQLALNPRVALCWFCDPLKQQVLIEGRVEAVSDEEADAYWASRPRKTQVGGWASLQSRTLPRRQQLEARFAKYERRFRARKVPRPAYWSGYRVIPHRIEFWKARPFRLNERILYQRLYAQSGDRWTVSLLYP